MLKIFQDDLLQLFITKDYLTSTQNPKQKYFSEVYHSSNILKYFPYLPSFYISYIIIQEYSIIKLGIENIIITQDLNFNCSLNKILNSPMEKIIVLARQNQQMLFL